MSDAELTLHRQGTLDFINADPTWITLVPYVEQKVNGTLRFAAGPPRIEQKFKLIWAGENGIIRQTPNGSRRFDFILVGQHDAIVDIADFWKIIHQEFRIEYVFPSNGYEVKAGGISNGPKPG